VGDFDHINVLGFNGLLWLLAVTLEGTIIHKSGLITGGRSTHSNGKKWDEKDVQGTIPNTMNASVA
jgi:chromosome segregation ATPase